MEGTRICTYRRLPKYLIDPIQENQPEAIKTAREWTQQYATKK